MATQLGRAETLVSDLTARLCTALNVDALVLPTSPSSSSSTATPAPLPSPTSLSTAQASAVADIASTFDESVVPAVTKLQKRAAELDPDTEKHTYGKKARARVQVLEGHFDALQDAIDPFREDAQSVLSEQRKKDKAAKSVKDKANRAALLKDQADRVVKAKHGAGDAVAPEVDAERLALAAEVVRKEREAEEKADPLRAAKSLLARELAKVINPKPKDLKASLTLLQDSLDADAVKLTLEMLEAILTNVEQHSENDLMRTVKCKNTHYLAGPGKVVPGGRECLLSLGFELMVDQEKKEAVFFMREPDPAEDLDGWSEWFAKLDEWRKFVKECAVRYAGKS